MGLIAESTAREVALAICEQTEQSQTLTLNDYVVAYNEMPAKHKPESPLASPKEYLPFKASTAWAYDGPPPQAWDSICENTSILMSWKSARFLASKRYDWTTWLNDSSLTLARSERIVLWGLLIWTDSYKGPSIPAYIIRELLLKAAVPKSQAREDEGLNEEEALTLWGSLSSVFHNDQLCLCKLYNLANECYMIAGLQSERLLTANAAKKVYDCIMRNRGANELLIAAYSRLLEKYPVKKKKKTAAGQKRGRGKS